MPGMIIDVPDDIVSPRASDTGNTAGFADLKEQLDAANKEREAEKKRADEAAATARTARLEADRARSDAQAARAEGFEGNKAAVANAITAKKSTLDGLEAEYRAAFDAGDSARLATIQRKMSEEAAELKTLESGHAALERDAPRRTAEGRQERQDGGRTADTDDPFEKYVRQFNPRSQDWLRKHPECVTNGTKNAQIVAAHHEAINIEGYAPESDEYFDYLDQKMGYRGDRARRAVAADNPIDDGDRQQRRSDPVRTSAAVSRGGGPSTSRVELSEQELAFAQDGTIVWNLGQTDGRGVRITEKDERLGQPIGVAEMARRKKALRQDGRYVIPSLQDA